MTQKLNYGEIWLANLNPGQGTEPGKTRPVLIIQTQALLDVEHPSTLIIPLTTNLIDNAEPLRVRVKAGGKLDQDSDLLIDQIRSIDNKRFLEGPLFKCEEGLTKKVLECVLEIIDAF
jgi:mRNA interferase MazF